MQMKGIWAHAFLDTSTQFACTDGSQAIVENQQQPVASIYDFRPSKYYKLECGPMPNVMVALPNIGGALCSTPQSLADAHY